MKLEAHMTKRQKYVEASKLSVEIAGFELSRNVFSTLIPIRN